MTPQVDMLSFVFSKNLKISKRHFEINWPLVVHNILKGKVLLQIFGLFERKGSFCLKLGLNLEEQLTDLQILKEGGGRPLSPGSYGPVV